MPKHIQTPNQPRKSQKTQKTQAQQQPLLEQPPSHTPSEDSLKPRSIRRRIKKQSFTRPHLRKNRKSESPLSTPEKTPKNRRKTNNPKKGQQEKQEESRVEEREEEPEAPPGREAVVNPGSGDEMNDENSSFEENRSLNEEFYYYHPDLGIGVSNGHSRYMIPVNYFDEEAIEDLMGNGNMGVIRAMLNRFEGGGINEEAGLTRKMVKRIPLVSFGVKKKNRGEVMESCSICFERFGEEENVRDLVCGHYFHPECVDVWLMQKAVCAICKFKLKDV